MFNHMVYDVFIKNEDDFKDEETGLRGMSRFGENLDAFTAKGLEFRQAPLHCPPSVRRFAAAQHSTAPGDCVDGADPTPLKDYP